MKKTSYIILCLMLLAGACNREELPSDDGTGIPDPKFGAVEFDFQLPAVGVPEKNVHRVMLNLAKSADSLNRKDFCSAANVSDHKQKYTFYVLPGRYFYQAGVTCTCGGDSCLYGGFPGGQLSIWWASGFVDIEKGKVYSQKINFQ